MKRIATIQDFLIKKSKFPNIYHSGLECHVQVSQDNGTPVSGGKAYQQGGDFWYSFRISNLVEEEKELNFSTEHIEAIGFSGWNFKEEKSEWVGYDFDSVIGHKKGLSDSELEEIIQRVENLNFITIRRSTSGKGIHLYVPISKSPRVESRKEHSLLSRSILSTLAGLLGFDFKTKVDTSGTILWVWHRRGNKEESFETLYRAAGTFSNFRPDWKEQKKEKKIQELAVNLKSLSLDDEQLKLLNWFSKQQTTWWWDAELNMLVCHTFDLSRAHKDLSFKGVFYTTATGKSLPHDQNCFAFPLKNGSWIVRRHGLNTKEHEYWKTDAAGWTFCYFNRTPTLLDLASINHGQQDSKNNVVITNFNNVSNIITHLNPNSQITLPEQFHHRQFKLKELSENRLSIVLEKNTNDEKLDGWVAGKNTWEKVINIIKEEPDLKAPDELIRHVISNNEDAGWYICAKNIWISEPKDNVKSVLISLGYKKSQIEELTGQCILNPWRIVSKPFEPEYPGNREWNKFSTQLMYEPKEGSWSKWKVMLDHLGKGLNDAVKSNVWCINNGIVTGSEYLKLWVASLFQFPQEPLPYLFFFGPQLSGKSSFHESLKLLVTQGVVQANVALTNQQAFNGELAGAILCYIEEVNLTQSKVAYDRIKDWVTSKSILIHPKMGTPINLDNTTHWVHCSNNSNYCPVSVGDTRIIIIFVETPVSIIPKQLFQEELREQASAFLYEILFNTTIPDSTERLKIPILETSDKSEEQAANANLVERFIVENIYIRDGQVISFEDFCVKFWVWLSEQGADRKDWSKIKISRSIPYAPGMPIKGKINLINYFGNASFNQDAENLSFRYIKTGDKLIKEEG